MNEKFITCECSSDEHTLRFIIDEDDQITYVTFHLNHFRFFKRIWIAIKYIFGYHCRYGHFEDIIMKKEDVVDLIEFLKKVG